MLGAGLPTPPLPRPKVSPLDTTPMANRFRKHTPKRGLTPFLLCNNQNSRYMESNPRYLLLFVSIKKTSDNLSSLFVCCTNALWKFTKLPTGT